MKRDYARGGPAPGVRPPDSSSSPLALPACCTIIPRANSAFGTKKVIGLSGTTALEQTFIAEAFSMLGMVAAAFAISLTLWLHQEEASQRAETLLARAVGRTRWLASDLAIALAGSAVAMLAAVQSPAAWLLAAVTLTLWASHRGSRQWRGRAGRIICGVLGGFVVPGSRSGLLDLEPFAHILRLGGGRFSPVPLLWLPAIDAALVAVGVAAFRRRGVRC